MNYVKIIVYGKTYYNYTHGVLCNYYINKSWKEQSSRKINCLHKNESLSVSTMVKIVPSYLLFCFFPPCPKTPIKVVSENTSFGSLLSVLSV
jgi:membrane protein YqaA with SNARE-associated domain